MAMACWSMEETLSFAANVNELLFYITTCTFFRLHFADVRKNCFDDANDFNVDFRLFL